MSPEEDVEQLQLQQHLLAVADHLLCRRVRYLRDEVRFPNRLFKRIVETTLEIEPEIALAYSRPQISQIANLTLFRLKRYLVEAFPTIRRMVVELLAGYFWLEDGAIGSGPRLRDEREAIALLEAREAARRAQ
jgi:hypothetical protein